MDSIWVIWTSGLHSWGMKICRKDKSNPEGHHSEGQVSGSLARAAWAVTRKISEGIECGGAHQRLSRRTELVGISLASGGRIALLIMDGGYNLTFAKLTNPNIIKRT